MKKFITVFAFVLFAAPMFASAHPNLSQFPIPTSRPVVTVPTAPSTGSSFSSSGGQCLAYWPWAPTVHTPCWYDIQGMLANLK